MTRAFTALLALAAAFGLTLAAPAVSHAQAPFGIQLGIGNSSFSYQQGYSYGPAYGGLYAPYRHHHHHYPIYRPGVVVPAAPLVANYGYVAPAYAPAPVVVSPRVVYPAYRY